MLRMPPNDARRLRLLADEALAISAGMTDAACRQMMLALAASYRRLADHAEEREATSLPLGDASLSNSQSDASDGKLRPLRS
jgi:hypothetical protein